MKWVLLNNDGSGPTARFWSCICLDESRIYIVGGQNYIKPFAEIWIYTYHTNTFSLLNENNDQKLVLIDFRCWLSDDYKFIYVVGGRSFAYLINPYFYYIEIIVNNGVMTTNISVLDT